MDLKRLGRTLSGIVLVASLLVHIGTFVPGIALSMHETWPLHLGAMASFGMLFLALGRLRVGSGHAAQRDLRRRAITATPAAAKVLFALTMVYVMFNFLAFMGEVPGTPEEVPGGGYALQNHGQVIRTLTRVEYQHFQTREVRGFSGHWVLFSLAPFLFFMWTWPRLQAAE